MTQEEKQLLLKDLCARLPYAVKAQYFDAESGRYEIDTIDGIDLTSNPEILISQYGLKVDAVKPYLRPMSSMTDEEKAQVQMFMNIVTDENYGDGYSPSAWDAMNGFVQYCDSHHLDHRGLIVKGLALEAPEGMYNI